MNRIKHTDREVYKLYSCLPCRFELSKGVKRWFFYKSYKTKSSALNKIKSYKASENANNDLIFKIVWCPYPFAAEEYCVDVYNESEV